MKILHTSDWHLGKCLEGYERRFEQESFLKEIVGIANEKEVDAIVIAGDVYDTANPPAYAERLFYDYIKKLSNGGKRAVIVIAGNHDSPERLIAANPLAREHGVLIFGKPGEVKEDGRYGGFDVTRAAPNFVEIAINGKTASFILMPYPSESRLSEVLTESHDENEVKKSYCDKLAGLLAEAGANYNGEGSLTVVTHLYVTGGESSESEREIQLGGAYSFDGGLFPEADYVALGHLHKPQRSKGKNTYYSGSPLQYSKSETGYSKAVYLAALGGEEGTVVEKIDLSNIKPIEVVRINGFNAAIDYLNENNCREFWCYLEVVTEKPFSQEELKKIKAAKPDILEIRPIIPEIELEEKNMEKFDEMEIGELFSEYYAARNGVYPKEELLNYFKSIAYGEEEQ